VPMVQASARRPAVTRTAKRTRPTVGAPVLRNASRTSARLPAARLSATPAARRGVLDRLRLGWLRKVFVGHAGDAAKSKSL